MPADLTASAASNRAARTAEAGSVMGGDPSGRLGAFRDFVASGSQFSTNVSADKIVAFEEAGEILDARAYCTHGAGGDSTVGLERFANLQRGWLVRREGFEDLWNGGRRLVYGAVNAGGMGVEGPFGPWCLVANPEQPPPEQLAVFPDDSAQRYTDSAGLVDSARATVEVTAWSECAELAVIERASEVLAVEVGDWPRVLCRTHRYLEVTRAGALPVSTCVEVRLRSTLRAKLDDLWARELAGEVVPELEENEVVAYRVVDAWRRTHGIGVTEVR